MPNPRLQSGGAQMIKAGRQEGKEKGERRKEKGGGMPNPRLQSGGTGDQGRKAGGQEGKEEGIGQKAKETPD